MRRYVAVGRFVGDLAKARAEDALGSVLSSTNAPPRQARDRVEGLVEDAGRIASRTVGVAAEELGRQLDDRGLGELGDAARDVARWLHTLGAPAGEPQYRSTTEPARATPTLARERPAGPAGRQAPGEGAPPAAVSPAPSPGTRRAPRPKATSSQEPPGSAAAQGSGMTAGAAGTHDGEATGGSRKAPASRGGRTPRSAGAKSEQPDASHAGTGGSRQGGEGPRSPQRPRRASSPETPSGDSSNPT